MQGASDSLVNGNLLLGKNVRRDKNFLCMIFQLFEQRFSSKLRWSFNVSLLRGDFVLAVALSAACRFKQPSSLVPSYKLTFVLQVQTRSADEPMTTFVLCNECGNRWKVSWVVTNIARIIVQIF